MIFKMAGSVFKIRQLLLGVIRTFLSCHAKLALLSKLQRDVAKVLCRFGEITLKRANLISVTGGAFDFLVGGSKRVGCATALGRTRCWK